ncbi:MAG: FAD-binding protein, partial [Acidimicrobiia bacterium]
MTTSSMDGGSWTNWVGNQSFSPREIVAVDSETDVQREVARASSSGHSIRTVGTGHSFTPIVETDVLLDTSPLRGIIEVDPRQLTVKAGPKTTIADFGDPLWEHGLALANQGDIDTQAIAGAIATATHGSGLKQPNFSAALEGAR